MPVTVYRSSDANAPPLMGAAGSFLSVLEACLVDGYGSTFAQGTITSDTVNVSDGDTVTIGSITYTFRSGVLTGQPAYAVNMGGSAAGSLIFLELAINGAAPSGAVSPGTNAHPDVIALTPTATVLTLQARKGGSGGNAIALSEASSHLVVGGANLAGGGGSNSKAGAGWTKPYATLTSRAGLRQGGGNQFYLFVDDNSPNATAQCKEAQCRGYETLADNTPSGTGPFPTVAQISSGCVVRKSTSLDSVTRQWIVVADNRTVYVFVDSGDGGHTWYTFTFGDIYSTMGPTDGFRTFICGRYNPNDATTGVETAFGVAGILGVLQSNHYMARAWTGSGGSVQVGKHTDWAKSVNQSPGGSTYPVGYGPQATYPNPEDGGLYLAPIWIHDYNGSVYSYRGRMRGVWAPCHPASFFADLDTFSGTAGTEFAGKTFMVLKPVYVLGFGGYVVVETSDTWETN
jgi:hypothetical protein